MMRRCQCLFWSGKYLQMKKLKSLRNLRPEMLSRKRLRQDDKVLIFGGSLFPARGYRPADFINNTLDKSI